MRHQWCSEIAKEKASLIVQLKKNPGLLIACQKGGIGRRTYYRWGQEDSAFVDFWYQIFSRLIFPSARLSWLFSDPRISLFFSAVPFFKTDFAYHRTSIFGILID